MVGSKVSTIALLTTVALALFVRGVGLGDAPLFNSDEVVYGVGAMSILATGSDLRDHDGGLPLYLRGQSDAFDNRTSVLYLYLSIPFYKLFGPSVVTARLLAVIVGTATVWLIGLVAYRLTRSGVAAVASAIALTFSIQHIFFSRTGQEFVFLPFFQLLLVWTFLKARDKPRWYALAPPMVALGLYSYQPLKLMGPLLFILLFALEWRHVRRTIHPWLVGGVLAVLLAAPSAWLHVTHWETLRVEFSLISIFRTPGWPVRFFGNYAMHFGPKFLEFVWLVGAPLFLLGIWITRKKRIPILLPWLVVAPIAGAITTAAATRHEYVYSHRSGGLWVIVALLIGIGVWHLWEWIRHRAHGRWAFLGTCILLFATIGATLPSYKRLVIIDYEKPLHDAVRFVSTESYRDREVVVSLWPNPGFFHGQQVLFAANDPTLFAAPQTWHQWRSANWGADIDYLTRVGRFSFCVISECFTSNDSRLYIVRPDELPELPRLATFSYVSFGRDIRWDIVDN